MVKLCTYVTPQKLSSTRKFYFCNYYCRNTDKSCSYLSDNVKSRCSQMYNYHRLLTWDEKTGLSLDLFKVSTLKIVFHRLPIQTNYRWVYFLLLRYRHAVLAKYNKYLRCWILKSMLISRTLAFKKMLSSMNQLHSILQ